MSRNGRPGANGKPLVNPPRRSGVIQLVRRHENTVEKVRELVGPLHARWAANIKRDLELDPTDPDCTSAYNASMKLLAAVSGFTGKAGDIADEIMRRLGVPIDQAQRAVSLVNQLEGASAEDTEAALTAWLADKRKREGRPALIDPERASDAQEVAS